MRYRCQFCDRDHCGSDTVTGFVNHMRIFHGVTITEEEVITVLNGSWRKVAPDTLERMKQAQQRRRLREKGITE